jgi:hypothetical protein
VIYQEAGLDHPVLAARGEKGAVSAPHAAKFASSATIMYVKSIIKMLIAL